MTMLYEGLHNLVTLEMHLRTRMLHHYHTCHSICFQHPQNFNVKIITANYYHNSYLPKVCYDWNSLPIATIEATTLHSFTTHMCNLLIGHMKAKL